MRAGATETGLCGSSWRPDRFSQGERGRSGSSQDRTLTQPWFFQKNIYVYIDKLLKDRLTCYIKMLMQIIASSLDPGPLLLVLAPGGYLPGFWVFPGGPLRLRSAQLPQVPTVGTECDTVSSFSSFLWCRAISRAKRMRHQTTPFSPPALFQR